MQMCKLSSSLVSNNLLTAILESNNLKSSSFGSGSGGSSLRFLGDEPLGRIRISEKMGVACGNTSRCRRAELFFGGLVPQGATNEL